MRLRTPAFLLALLAFALPAGADHCVQPNYGRDSEELRVLDPRTGKAQYYVEVDQCQAQGCAAVAVWIYEESNGFSNLQRREGSETDRARFSWYQDDTCHGAISPDSRDLLS